MSWARGLACLCVITALAGCRPKASTQPEPARSTSEPAGLTLEEIAAHVDPGPQTPISEGLPPWIFELLGLEERPSESGAALLERAVAEYKEYERGMKGAEDLASMVVGLRAAARSVILAEQAASRGAAQADALARLERAYLSIDVPTLASDQNTFARFLSAFLEAAEGQMEGSQESLPRASMTEIVQGAIAAAGPLHRRSVAQLLRLAPEHSAVPTAILAVAMRERGEDEDWAIPAAKHALELRGASVSTSERLDLARICFCGLDIDCGESALPSSGDVEGDDEVEVEYAEVLIEAALARRIVELVEATTIEERLERARAMLRLGRHRASKAEYEALQAAFPGDARPVSGLALHAVETGFDFLTAHQIIDAREGLHHADAEYYELAIGTRLMTVMGSVLPSLVAAEAGELVASLEPQVRRMRADIDGYAAFRSSDAAYLGFLLDLVEEVLGRYKETGEVGVLRVRSLSARALALQAAIPDNAHAYRLLMSASMFEAERAQAASMTAVLPPAGPERDALAQRRARALADLAVLWSDLGFAERAREALAGVDAASSVEAAELHADVSMVVRLLGGDETWTRVGEAYEPLIDEDMTDEDARALNNIALAVMKNDGLEVAQQAWTLSAELAEDHGDVPRLNLLVAAAPPKGDAAALAGMRALAEETTITGVRVTALAWVHAWSRGRARRAAEAALRREVEKARAEGLRPAPPDPYSGVVLEGSMQAGFGYAIESGLQIELDGSGLPWGILAPPRTR